jgi:hypothetical protein
MKRGLCITVSTVLAVAASTHADLDLTTAGSSGYINGAFYQQVSPQTTGTGVIEPFLRIQNNGTEQGYNTDGALEFDTKAGLWTHSLLLSDVPIVTLSDGIAYRQFLLDINQNQGGTHELLSLNELKLYQSNSNTLTGYYNVAFGPTIYDLDGAGDMTITLNYLLNPGSGAGDMFAYIPNSLFNGQTYVYMYNNFGQPNESNDGFEEWAVLEGSTTIIPAPGASVLGLIGMAFVAVRRRVQGV